MDKKSYSENFIHISEANKRALDEISYRKKYGFTGLKTRWRKLNSLSGGGFQWGFSYLIAGLSGSGKTTLANIIETDLFDFNSSKKFKILNFNFETEAYMNVIKKYSAKTHCSTDHLLSVGETISDEEFDALKVKAAELNKYEIYYFEKSGNVNQICTAALDFQKQNPEHKLVIMLDHTALVTMENEKDELELITRLARASMWLKKQIGCVIIFLGQLNSNIEDIERIRNDNLHYPVRSDLFGAKSVYNAMDVVWVPHRPEMLNIANYGPYKMPTKDMIFFHIIKQRYGRVGFFRMTANMEHNSIEEYEEPLVEKKQT